MDHRVRVIMSMHGVTSHLDTYPDLPVGGEGAAEEHPAPLVPRTLVRSPHLPGHGEGEH